MMAFCLSKQHHVMAMSFLFGSVSYPPIEHNQTYRNLTDLVNKVFFVGKFWQRTLLFHEISSRRLITCVFFAVTHKFLCCRLHHLLSLAIFFQRRTAYARTTNACPVVNFPLLFYIFLLNCSTAPLTSGRVRISSPCCSDEEPCSTN